MLAQTTRSDETAFIFFEELEHASRKFSFIVNAVRCDAYLSHLREKDFFGVRLNGFDLWN
jgi:hypothetical protein